VRIVTGIRIMTAVTPCVGSVLRAVVMAMWIAHWSRMAGVRALASSEDSVPASAARRDVVYVDGAIRNDEGPWGIPVALSPTRAEASPKLDSEPQRSPRLRQAARVVEGAVRDVVERQHRLE
jgi:hypothetical protein